VQPTASNSKTLLALYTTWIRNRQDFRIFITKLCKSSSLHIGLAPKLRFLAATVNIFPFVFFTFPYWLQLGQNHSQLMENLGLHLRTYFPIPFSST
jgi:hypothetical protein